MYKVKLLDGTVITNCAPGTTSDNIIKAGDTYAEAASILDVITPENSKAVLVLDENDQQVAYSSDVILLSGGELGDSGAYKTCTVRFRHKTDQEKMQDEISELQEVVIEA